MYSPDWGVVDEDVHDGYICSNCLSIRDRPAGSHLSRRQARDIERLRRWDPKLAERIHRRLSDILPALKRGGSHRELTG